MFTEVGLLDDFLQVVEARLVVGQRPQMCSLPLSQREMNSKTTHGVECMMRVAMTHPAHEGPRLQPERDGRVRWSAWLGHINLMNPNPPRLESCTAVSTPPAYQTVRCSATLVVSPVRR